MAPSSSAARVRVFIIIRCTPSQLIPPLRQLKGYVAGGGCPTEESLDSFATDQGRRPRTCCKERYRPRSSAGLTHRCHSPAGVSVASPPVRRGHALTARPVRRKAPRAGVTLHVRCGVWFQPRVDLGEHPQTRADSVVWVPRRALPVPSRPDRVLRDRRAREGSGRRSHFVSGKVGVTPSPVDLDVRNIRIRGGLLWPLLGW